MIEIKNLSKSFGKQQVLNTVSLEFTKGQSVALIGPNGSGKTTLLKSILGLVIPDEGTIKVNGQDIADGCAHRKNIGYMPQISRFPDHMRVYQLFSMMSGLRKDITRDQYDMELYDAYQIDKIGNKALGTLSGGMRQHISAALAFMFDPSIIILDEPTAALDPISNEQLKQKINKCIRSNKLVVITSHILNDLDEVTNHALYLMQGKVIFNVSVLR